MHIIVLRIFCCHEKNLLFICIPDDLFSTAKDKNAQAL